MKIDLFSLPEEGKQFTGEEPSAALDTDKGVMVRCVGPLHYDLFAQVVTGNLLVSGSLAVKAETQCVKCAEIFPLEVKETSYHFDMEVDENTECADLTEDMRGAIILSFPLYPECSESCKGLCPQCGANRNQTTCTCSAPEDPRWGALEGL